MAINHANFTGNLVRDAELRATTSGTEVLNFTVAVEDYRKDAENYVNYLDCVLFGGRASKLAPRLTKGTWVCIEARARQNRWEQDGQKRQRIEFIVNEVEFKTQQSESVELADEDYPF